jgi:hypothetical protein
MAWGAAVAVHGGFSRFATASSCLASVALAASLLVSGPARAASSAQVVQPSYFGVHQSWLGAPEPRGWPLAEVGAVRLWDNGVTWRDLETAPGRYSWQRLDRLVAQAQAHGASVLLVLGQTPAFHAARPDAVGFFGPGATSMPLRDPWLRYVRKLARRNLRVWGGGVEFQVWNEGNNPQYWTGTSRQLARLARWTRTALDAVDPDARLVAPRWAPGWPAS